MTILALAAAMLLGLVAGPAGQAPQSWHQVNPLPTAEITVGGVPLTVELAIAPADQARGLGERDGLAPGAGMLFIYEAPAPRSFWMKGMRFCLDIVWIENGTIQGAAEGVCPEPATIADAELPSYVSPVPVTYVLEVPSGWLDAHGFGIGTPVDGLPTLAP